MSVIAVGTDLHRIGRFAAILARHGLASPHVHRLAARVLHPDRELPGFVRACQQSQLDKCTRALAHSWCVKEALYKTLDTPDQATFAMRHWYKYNHANGRPHVASDSYARHERFLVSLSHDGDYVSSVVVRAHGTN
ncbi:hypothetical protein KL930_003351 [Ogataea haglerorum]|uniref:4'-phosphopantetheinyl transferase domain-containing protein n=1 Tax=Ogataea haglerorum TaxID=1937702 RepID=A0AAN6HYN7_9ASCO|nr:uncharacterized protein KL911_002399 [Ogataea haglerorum]KAG7696325.1 hypothetical protein KL915_002689 [Ogataea haglerorum]KAG7696697.1 hypothetical protein KL951_003153 [Ogataea haglerorum]KAG7706858.1 hypothetical protein KL914_002742 [Ogataea haglerorum]KAG7708834.1 hypothetical protein KL950_002354 [Ogataea haglerorum]KAG7716329.1 hypothetical protein KL913_003540 [Ogataea haglerorum]